MKSDCGVLNVPKDRNYSSLNHCMSWRNSDKEGFYSYCREIGNVLFVIVLNTTIIAPIGTVELMIIIYIITISYLWKQLLQLRKLLVHSMAAQSWLDKPYFKTLYFPENIRSKN